MTDLTKPVQTRDGRMARVLATDLLGADSGGPGYEGSYDTVVVAVTQENGRETVYTYQPNGRYWTGSSDIDLDLVNVPEKDERFVNVYRTEKGSTSLGAAHKSPQSADDALMGSVGFVGQLKLTFNGDRLRNVEVI